MSDSERREARSDAGPGGLTVNRSTTHDAGRESQQGGDTMGEGVEMPRYRSHKTVWALKIKSIAFDYEQAQAEGRETDGSATITPEESGYLPFKVDAAYVRKHDPKAGGYYVVYADGYKSWSPADAFESGYTRL
jgi:hypothetical protein